MGSGPWPRPRSRRSRGSGAKATQTHRPLPARTVPGDQAQHHDGSETDDDPCPSRHRPTLPCRWRRYAGMAWLPFTYRDFHDLPRAIIVAYRGHTYFLDCPVRHRDGRLPEDLRGVPPPANGRSLPGSVLGGSAELAHRQGRSPPGMGPAGRDGGPYQYSSLLRRVIGIAQDVQEAHGRCPQAPCVAYCSVWLRRPAMGAASSISRNEGSNRMSPTANIPTGSPRSASPSQDRSRETPTVGGGQTPRRSSGSRPSRCRTDNRGSRCGPDRPR